jgi:hypothetical protein
LLSHQGMEKRVTMYVDVFRGWHGGRVSTRSRVLQFAFPTIDLQWPFSVPIWRAHTFM